MRGQTQLFLAGPPLLKAATGEVADHETLGGAEMHATVSQTGEYLAESDEDGIRIARMVVSQLPPDAGRALSPDQDALSPRYPRVNCAALFLRIKDSLRHAEVIMRIVDDSRFDEFQPVVDQQTLCGHVTSVVGEWELLPIMGRSLPKGRRRLPVSSAMRSK